MTLQRAAPQMLQMSTMQDNALTEYHRVAVHVQFNSYNVIGMGPKWQSLTLQCPCLRKLPWYCRLLCALLTLPSILCVLAYLFWERPVWCRRAGSCWRPSAPVSEPACTPPPLLSAGAQAGLAWAEVREGEQIKRLGCYSATTLALSKDITTFKLLYSISKYCNPVRGW